MRRWRALGESCLFVASVTVGVFGLGRGLAWLLTPTPRPQGGLWLGVAGVAWFALARQMGRVQDAWPRRKEVRRDDPS